jgi:hypothetical protein
MNVRRHFVFTIPAALLAATRAFAGELKRRPAIPLAVIQRFNMQPSTGGFTVLGEDGRSYDLDETFRVLFDMAKTHWMGK